MAFKMSRGATLIRSQPPCMNQRQFMPHVSKSRNQFKNFRTDQRKNEERQTKEAMTHWSPVDYLTQSGPQDPPPKNQRDTSVRTQRDPALMAQRRDLACMTQEAPRLQRSATKTLSPLPVVRDPVKYKTEVCNKWDERQDCRYGTKCQYAHGTEDLRPKITHHPHYRTIECKHFHKSPKEEPTCPWGVRCVFKHTERGARDNPRVIFTGAARSPSSRTSRSPLITPLITPANSPTNTSTTSMLISPPITSSPPIIAPIRTPISPIISPTITSATTPFITPPTSPIISPPIITPISPLISPTTSPSASTSEIIDDFMEIMIHKMVEDVLKEN